MITQYLTEMSVPILTTHGSMDAITMQHNMMKGNVMLGLLDAHARSVHSNAGPHHSPQ